jgi:hypothetical protein
MMVQASTEDYLYEVIAAHKKKPLILGQSQCDKKIAGLI